MLLGSLTFILLWYSGYGVGLAFSDSAVRIPEGEVNFFIIITGDTALLIICIGHFVSVCVCFCILLIEYLLILS